MLIILLSRMELFSILLLVTVVSIELKFLEIFFKLFIKILLFFSFFESTYQSFCYSQKAKNGVTL